MADTPELTSPRLVVTSVDGGTFEVQTLNPDLIRFDMTRSRHGWPDAQAAPFLWLTFIAWAALKREGAIPSDLTWETFSETMCIDVRTADDGEEVARPGFPTPEEPAPE
jgi:hypothetical protein